MSLNPFVDVRLELFKTNWQIDTIFDTLLLEDGGGREQRFCRITEPMVAINADGMILDGDEFTYLKAFFDARDGKYEGFRFKNELDYTLTQSPEFYSDDLTVYQQGILAQISGSTYQILKRYHVNGTNTYKTIRKPVDGTVKVYSDDVELTTGWSVDIDTGIVTFSSTPSGVLTVSCEYDLPMRFDMDEDQLNHIIVETNNTFHTADDTYKVLQLALIEDSYDKFNNYAASDFDDINYSFIPDPLPEITKGTFTVTKIKSTQSKKEKRTVQSTGKASRKLGQNKLFDNELKTLYTLFVVAKGRKLAFDYSGVSYRFDSDNFKCSLRVSNGSYTVWDFSGIDLKQSIIHDTPKINTLCHCLRIKINGLKLIVTENLDYLAGQSSLDYTAYIYGDMFNGGVSSPVSWTPIGYRFAGPITSTSLVAVNSVAIFNYPAWQLVINGVNFGGWDDDYDIRVYPDWTGNGGMNTPTVQLVLFGSNERDVIQVSQSNLTDVISVQNANGSITYTEGVDYEIVNLTSGQIKPLAGGSIQDGQNLRIVYEYIVIGDSYIGFTSHDRDLIINGVTYHAKTAIDPTAFRRQIGLNPDNLDVQIFLDSGLIRDVDVRAGKYDNSEITKAIIDYANLPDDIEQGYDVIKGNIGKISLNGDLFMFGVDTKDAVLSKPALQKFTNVCRWEKRLEDPRCPKDINTLKITGVITSVVNTIQFYFDQVIEDPFIFDQSSGGGYLIAETGDNIGIKFWINYVQNNGRIELKIAAPYTWQNGDTVTIYPGCNGLRDTCDRYFNALDGWGGCPTDGNFAPALSDLVD